MMNSIAASLVLLGAFASAQSAGSAHVVNLCSYDVFLSNVPASGGGYEQTDMTLAAGQSWEYPWTELSNGAGWSIKLSKAQDLADILQYEYTFHNDGTIWYDLSCVNGNPWDKNWEITAAGDSCSPKQQAYRYATDDAYGMQSCSQDSSITVTLCSGEAADNGASNDSGSAPPAPSSAAAPAYTPVPAPSAAVAPSYSYNWNNDDVSASLSPETDSAVATPTTFATQVTQVAVSANGAEVTEVATVFVTDVVTAYAGKARARRHEHHVHRHHHA